MRINMLMRLKNRVPIFFGILTVVLYLVVLNLASYGIAVLGGRMAWENPYPATLRLKLPYPALRSFFPMH